MKVTAKLMAVFLTAVMLLTAIYGWLSVRREAQLFRERHHQQAREMAAAMEDSLLLAWRREGRAGVLQVIQTTRLPQHDSVRWVWLNGDQDAADSPAAPRDVLAQIPLGQLTSFHHRDEQGQRRLLAYYPIHVGQGRVGALEFTRSLSPLNDETRDTVITMLVLIVAIAVACIAIVYVAGIKLVGRPLDRLIEKTRRTGQGDFSEPLELHQDDELGQLASALNQMCDQLRQQQDAIQSEGQARLATLQQLRHADRLKTVGRLAAGIAHELGTPLNVVSGRAGLIAGGKLSDDEVKHSADAIKTEADRITTIIRQLLDFARRNTPQRTSADLRAVLKQTADLLRTLADKNNVSVELDLPDAGATTLADVGQLQQVLTNVLMNAIQSMPDGGSVAVHLSSAHVTPPEDVEATAGNYFQIAIQDQGTGVEADHLEHIFEPFFTTKDVGQGTGLGLSIAYGIVLDHGGWIDVQSQPGHGSCFAIYLPEEPTSCPEES